MRALLVLALLSALAASACNGGDSGSDDEGSALATTTAAPAATTTLEAPEMSPVPVSGASCSPARPHESGSSNKTIASAGGDRSYILHIPEAYAGSAAVPLVLNLHGYGSNAQQQNNYSALPAKADREGFIVATPQGTGATAFWNIGALSGFGPDDVAFISDLLDTLETELCIDADRIYSAGMSNGGAMSLRLACDLSDRIAAVASVTGTFLPPNCPQARDVPVIAFHGTDDAVVPFEGGPLGAGLGARYGLSSPPIEETVAGWAERNDCSAAAAQAYVTASVRLVRYLECAADVELHVVEGGGHTWPGAADVPRLGTTTHEINATDLIWEFFEARPRDEY
jgi:polyhydroxybutyrate depolymerase